MALSIKDPVADRLARQLAKKTGENITAALTKALEERLERLERGSAPASALEEIRRIRRKFREQVGTPFSSLDHGDLLYDDAGLPK